MNNSVPGPLLKITPDVPSSLMDRIVSKPHSSLPISRITPSTVPFFTMGKDSLSCSAPLSSTTSTSSNVKIAIQQTTKAANQFQERLAGVKSANDVPKSGLNKIPSPPHLKYSQQRPIMPKPIKQAPQQSNQQSMIYICLPSVQQQKPTLPVSGKPTLSEMDLAAIVPAEKAKNGVEKVENTLPVEKEDVIMKNSSDEDPHFKKSPKPVKVKRISNLSDEPVKKKTKENNHKPARKSVDGLIVVERKDEEPSEKFNKKKRQVVVSHFIDGFVMLESDRPILSGTEGNENEYDDTKKRKKRQRHSSCGSSVATSASHHATPETVKRRLCFKCKKPLPEVSSESEKKHTYAGHSMCSFPCFSQVRREISAAKQKSHPKPASDEKIVENLASSNGHVHQSKSMEVKPVVKPVEKVTPSKQQVPKPNDFSRDKSPMKHQNVPALIPVASNPPVAAAYSEKQPSQWTVQDVNDFIKSIPGCEEAAQKFLEQEVDGPALLVLKNDEMVQLMGLKIGPVVKITSQLSNLFGRNSSAIGRSPPSAQRLPYSSPNSESSMMHHHNHNHNQHKT